jgi:hypothetical protein
MFAKCCLNEELKATKDELGTSKHGLEVEKQELKL